ncbi:hypothetical protein HF086_000677 [Spodoptera exigua]|uniref:Uncharacterized protein n=1 Tax=Spodoptera exigua TaxID=7107 RepID=A0A922MX95_SPOEX|nr:hypothetical protein HF086_000677 [Spodoptera exigua]
MFVSLQKRLCCAAKKALSKIPLKSLKTDDRFTGSQESILQLEVEEARSRALSPARNRHPLTLVHLTSDNSYEEAGSERSSRASSPDELVPSLPRNCDTPRHHHPSRSCTSSPSGSQRAETSRQDAATTSSAVQE